MLNSTEITDVNALNRRRLDHNFDRNDDLPMAPIADSEYQMLADELPVASVLPVAQPLPIQPARDYAAEAWKGRDSIASHAGAIPMAVEAPSDSWWNRARNWWSGAEAPRAVDQPATNQLVEDSAEDPMDVETSPVETCPSPMEVDTAETAPAEDSAGLPFEPPIPVAHPTLPSIRQLCRQIVEKKSKELDDKFAKKKSEWTAAHDKITQVKDLLKLMASCKNAHGELDLSLKDAKTLQLIEKLEQRRAAGDPPLPKRYSAEEYNTLFNSIKDEQDNLSFNHNMLAEEMKEMSQERAQVHQYMFSLAKADYDTCRAIIQRISR